MSGQRSSSKSETVPLLPSGSTPRSVTGTRRSAVVTLSACGLVLLVAAFGFMACLPVLKTSQPDRVDIGKFFSSVRTPMGLCKVESTGNVSHAGFIGLDGDTDETPKRSFFWFFEAQEDSKNAPIILGFGGGPGTSGMSNPLKAQSHCVISQTGEHVLVSNPYAWTERFNLIALDHPIGAGFSYGQMVNNSRAAAIDVYDFLQKFFVLYLHFAKNQFVVTSGSYGGMYVPHVATVIHEQNHAIASGKGRPGAIHINLESLMVSNPISDSFSHYGWMLQQRCYNTKLYNSTQCAEKYEILPLCLEKIEYALLIPSAVHRREAQEFCGKLEEADTHGVPREDVRKRCNGTIEDCMPWMGWMEDLLNDPSTRRELGIPEGSDHDFHLLSDPVLEEFRSYGDEIQRAHLLYEPLLRDGIRVLHLLGMQDCNCAWPGVLSFLKLIHSQFQEDFIHAPDVPWPTNTSTEATVRVIGEGSGNMTYVQIVQAGHFVVMDQPALVKKMVESWIDNKGFF